MKGGIKKIKNYRLIREVGRGANGVIYESVDESNNHTYAIKAIPSDKISEKHILESFKNELRALHKINHENIVKLYGVEKTQNNVYLVLGYANGGNLQQYLNYYQKKHKKQIPVEIVQYFIKKISKGLEYLHKNNIMHRDLKLENILLHFQGAGSKVNLDKVDIFNANVLIADLGFAKLLSNQYDETQTICGTPIIMAPDIINVKFNPENKNINSTYNSKVDLWSLGAISYQLLFGIPPFLARNVHELFKEILKGKFFIEKNVKVSVEAVTFLNGLLQFYPEKRMNWEMISKHPFLITKHTDFRDLELDHIETDSLKKIEIDTKNSENLLWILFRPKTKTIKLEEMSIENTVINSQSFESNKTQKSLYEDINRIRTKDEQLIVNGSKEEKHFDKEKIDIFSGDNKSIGIESY